jgi:hypothetical protein
MPTMPTMLTLPDDLLVEAEDAQRDGRPSDLLFYYMQQINKNGSLDDALTRNRSTSSSSARTFSAGMAMAVLPVATQVA